MYIPKEYYKAVMFVKKLRQDGKDLSEAVSISSKYYKVPEDELKKYLEDESGIETRFKYYTVQRLVATMDRPDFRPDGNPYVVKATSGIKVMERCMKENTSLELSKRKNGKKTCVYMTRFIGLMSGYSEKSQAEANISKC
ncbi:hypothetical protein [Oribacterium sp. NK2B42]|uniref:hypothetical protein n=1 Tax=Oribacterium sp. NK2B42 TaxID=689781 RepID=UPI0003FC3FCF|nr:hypothetical protein [Oribacterium sp. NK2B42]